MHAVRYRSPSQLIAGLCAKVRHAEPQLRSRRRTDRIEANARIRECEREMKAVICGPGFVVGVEL